MMFVVRLRYLFGPVPVTESHPKALLLAMDLDGEGFAGRYSVIPDGTSEHERDALISAVAAREGFCDRWTLDLTKERNANEQDPDEFWLAPIRYFWPND
jgi:hypothetical protein